MMDKRMFGTVACLVAMTVAIAACSSSSHKAKATTTTVAASTSTSTSSVAPTTTSTPPTTAPPTTVGPAPDGATAAKRFFAAWLAHDAAGLRANGSTSAVAAAIAEYPHSSGTPWVLSNCQGAAGTEYCTWVRAAEDVVVPGSNVTTPHVATDFQWHALQAPDIAQQFLSAWYSSNDAALRALGTPDAVSAIDATAAAKDGAWQPPTSCDGTAGSFYCVFTHGAHRLTIRVGDVQVPHQVIGVTYS